MQIKYILSHPTQYQSPFIKYLVKKGVKISVLYRSDMSVKEHFDPGFGKKINLPFLNPNFIHKNMLGYTLLTIAQK